MTPTWKYTKSSTKQSIANFRLFVLMYLGINLLILMHTLSNISKI